MAVLWSCRLSGPLPHGMGDGWVVSALTTRCAGASLDRGTVRVAATRPRCLGGAARLIPVRQPVGVRAASGSGRSPGQPGLCALVDGVAGARTGAQAGRRPLVCETAGPSAWSRAAVTLSKGRPTKAFATRPSRPCSEGRLRSSQAPRCARGRARTGASNSTGFRGAARLPGAPPLVDALGTEPSGFCGLQGLNGRFSLAAPHLDKGETALAGPVSRLQAGCSCNGAKMEQTVFATHSALLKRVRLPYESILRQEGIE